MMDFKRYLAFATIMIMSAAHSNSKLVSCVDEAIQQAPKLIEFHASYFGGLDGFRVEVDESSAKTIRGRSTSSVNINGITTVSVRGTVYKGNYETQFTFLTTGGSCTLIGQQIIEIGIFEK